MNVKLECIPCFFKQVQKICSECEIDKFKCMDYFKKVSDTILDEKNFSKTPPEISMKIYEILSNGDENYDPYRDKKEKLSKKLLKIENLLREEINKSDDRILTGLKLAISGNIIDFGAKDDVDFGEIFKNIEKVKNFLPDVKTLDKFKKDLDSAKKILYIGDNSGEIIFDKIFIEVLPREKITFVVRGGPIINDVTLKDAKTVGLTKIVNVIDTGLKMPGLLPKLSSREFLKEYSECDMVISKGQGNFETLEGEDKNIYFLFQAKCPVIANYLGLPINQFVFYNRELGNG